MSVVVVSIRSSVGLRNGTTRLPNRPEDMATIQDLFDRIPVSSGGSKEIAGVWATDREPLIQELATQIAAFQTANSMDAVDSAVDPGGRTLRLMNQLADDPPLSATVAPTPAGWDQDIDITFEIADTASMSGKRALVRAPVTAAFTRRLVSVQGSSIKWFGVALTSGLRDASSFQTPHVFFTPTPWQGGYQNPGYDAFDSWGKLWADYTMTIGRQVSASGSAQILVIPFYKNGQERDLGGAFLSDWKDVIAKVVTAAVNDIDPNILSGPYSFDSIVSSSFSNGYVAHKTFNGGAGVSDATSLLFDLDGQAGGSTWRPSNGIIYQNVTPPFSGNPAGNLWYVGGRWGNFIPNYIPVNTHSYCVNFLLFHGLATYC